MPSDFIIEFDIDSTTSELTEVVDISLTPGVASWSDLNGKPAVIAAGSTITEARTAINLQNVDNTSDVNKPVSTATQTAIQAAITAASSTAQTNLNSAIASLTKSSVGLGNVDNTSDVNKPVSTATQAALNNKENTITPGVTSQYWRGDKTWQNLDKSSISLGNVDNTSDVNKPISNATQTALNTKENTITAGTASQYWRGDKTWQTLDKSSVGLSNVDNTSDATKNSAVATLTNKTLTSPKISYINDANGNINAQFQYQANAVNYLSISNNATAWGPILEAVGSDTDISLYLKPKNAGAVNIWGGSGQTTLPIAANGTASNINLNLLSKGTGSVLVNNNIIVDINSAQTLSNKTLANTVTSFYFADSGIGNNNSKLLSTIKDPNPEGPTFWPDATIHNDLAYLYERGGTVTLTLNGVTQNPGLYTSSIPFNMGNNVGGYWGTPFTATTDVIVFTITTPTDKSFLFTNIVGIAQGYGGGLAKDVTIEAYYNGAWNTVYSVTNQNNNSGLHYKKVNPGSYSITQLRYTLTNWTATTGVCRVSSIFMTSYASSLTGSTFVTRNGGALYGSATTPITFTATGSDSNININFVPKGTGTIQANGVDVVTTTGTQTLSSKTLTAPALTGTSKVSSTGSLEIYNTADQTTNYEKLFIGYSANTVNITSSAGGTGVVRPILLGGSTGLTIDTASVTKKSSILMDSGVSGINIFNVAGQLTASSGSAQVSASVTPTINQTGTGAYTALLINPTETATGTGSKRLIDAQVGGTSKFVVFNNGDTRVNGLLDQYYAGILGFSGTASAVNLLQIANAATGSSPAVVAAGSDTNVTLALQPKGAGAVQLWGGTSQTAMTLAAASGATNVDLNITTKGTGVVKANGVQVADISSAQTLTNKSLTNPVINNDGTANGAVAFKSGGLARVYFNAYASGNPDFGVEGPDANINLDFIPKGTGAMRITGLSGQTVSTLYGWGTATNVDLDLRTRGTGTVKANGVDVVTTTGAQTLTNKTINNATLSSPLISIARLAQINDTTYNNPNTVFAGVSGAVNYLTATNSAAGNPVSIAASGSDANISINLVPKGTGTVQTNGNTILSYTSAPATATSTGVVGQMAIGADNYLYVCTAANTWKRTNSPLATF